MKIEKKEWQKGKLFFSLGVKEWLVALSVTLITFLVFLPALGNDFVNWDDFKFVRGNEHIKWIDLDFLKWIFTNRETQWSPLRWISHAIDYKVWGLIPLGHHLSSIILHSINTLLAVVLIIKLLKIDNHTTSFSLEGEKKFYKKAFMASALTGILFGIHPLRVESVVWISERKDVLYAFFYLLSLIFYLHYSLPSHKKKKYVFYILCLFCFVCASMSKAMAITLPFVFIILDVYPLKRITFSGFNLAYEVLIEKIPFLGISIIVSLINIGAHEEFVVISPFITPTVTERIIVAFKSISFYLVKMVWPFHLAPYYPYPEEISLTSPDYLGSFIFVLGVTIFSLFQWRKGRKIWLIIYLYYIITLLPVLGIIQFSPFYAADRYTYMPSLGPFLLIGLGLFFIWDKMSLKGFSNSLLEKLALLIIISVIGFLSVLTVKQTKIWSNSITLWNHEIKQYPSATFGYRGRAQAYLDLGENQKALDDLNKAIMHYPQYADAYVIRAKVFSRLGDYQKALENLNKAVEINPYFSIAYTDRCGLYIQKAFYQRAIVDCSKALEINPRDAVAYNNRGIAFHALGEINKAIVDFSDAIEHNSVDSDFYRNRGTIYMKAGKKNQAIRDFQKAAKLGDEQAQEFLKEIGVQW